ncbi:antigen 5 like allergen Cul n 1 [Musca domestica]|uniref:Antigen 5 like allergen Cul n 1 n=1 Tax=Musca domestica TaxID=7370 RepID=A0A9J7I9U3_MUSDO|nr:antigen 5 like allergen Cul n 1 [Musca domestica]
MYYVRLTVLVLQLSVLGSGEGIDYCDENMCPYQGKHVACGHKKTFSKRCEGDTKLEDMRPFKGLIMDEHNYYRNKVASGQVKCFYPAVRMPSLMWDDGLADTAEYNVMSCVFAHDQCRSTKKFPMAGQNIYTATTRKLDIPISGFIKEAIFLWYEEQFDANHSVLESYHKTIPQTGHFTLLVSDRQTHVGCAFLNMMLHGSPGKRMVIFTCNYSSTNIRSIPSYKPGPPGSQCKKRHHKYDFLCDDHDINSDDLSWYRKS